MTVRIGLGFGAIGVGFGNEGWGVRAYIEFGFRI